MNKIEHHPIGVIHSPFQTPEGTPIQSTAAKGVKGKVEVFPQFSDGLADLDGFSHIILLYHFHLAKKFSLRVKPYLDDELHGLFATRTPSRPNPIGISVVRLMKIKNKTLYVQDIDVVDKTPLLDIKPYVPDFDVRKANRIGWIEKKIKNMKKAIDNGRFTR